MQWCLEQKIWRPFNPATISTGYEVRRCRFPFFSLSFFLSFFLSLSPLSPHRSLHQVLFTSGYGQRCEFVLGNRESGVIVGGDAQVVPRGRDQVQNYEVAARFNVVRHLVPFLLVPESHDRHL